MSEAEIAAEAHSGDIVKSEKKVLGRLKAILYFKVRYAFRRVVLPLISGNAVRCGENIHPAVCALLPAIQPWFCGTDSQCPSSAMPKYRG